MRASYILVAWLAGCGAVSGRSDDAFVAHDLAVGKDLAACNSVARAKAPMIAIAYADTSAPAFGGGTISDGTYFMTAGTIYTGAGGMTGTLAGTFQAVYVFSGNRLELSAATPAAEVVSNVEYTTSGSSIVITPTCGTGQVDTDSYTVDDSGGTTTFTFGAISDGKGNVFTFTRQ